MKRKLTRKQIGSLGGKAGTGKAKARSSKVARAAALVRWVKFRIEKGSKKRKHAKVSQDPTPVMFSYVSTNQKLISMADALAKTPNAERIRVRVRRIN